VWLTWGKRNRRKEKKKKRKETKQQVNIFCRQSTYTRPLTPVNSSNPREERHQITTSDQCQQTTSSNSRKCRISATSTVWHFVDFLRRKQAEKEEKKKGAEKQNKTKRERENRLGQQTR